MEAIHCIGDSHASFFSGTDRLSPIWPGRSRDRLPFFRSYRVGPALAWSLGRSGTTSRGREQVEALLREAVPPGAPVLFLFGEIDCRCHLLPQAAKQGKPAPELAAACAEVYFEAARELAGPDRPVLFCVPPASPVRRMEGPDEPFPTVGSCVERNAVTRAFGARLKELCAVAKTPCVDFLDALIDAKGETRPVFYRDEIHLSQRAMPLAVEALRRAWPAFDGKLPPFYRAKLAFAGLTGTKMR